MLTKKQWESVLEALFIARDIYHVKGANKAIKWVQGKLRDW